MSKLAVFGGTPVRTELFNAYNTIGEEEIEAVRKVMETGVLSQFIGAWHKDFYGGPKVREFESQWALKCNAKHAITVNSNTSGIITACGAIGIKPGDEVIVSPYSMSISATAPIIWGGIPVFADIDENNFCISPESIRSKITKRTKAIIVVHIMGHPADMDEIMQIANENNLQVIEDAAQTPFGRYKNRFVGTIGHIGVFSLNYHKHIHTGEGGVITTNNDRLAERCQLIRNHGESVVGAKGVQEIDNIIGFNFRLGEIEAVIGIEQLKKVDSLLKERQMNAAFLNKNLQQIKYLNTCIPSPNVSHTYYIQPLKYYDEKNFGLSRDKYLKALSAELPSSYMREDIPLIGGGYVKPLYLHPIFQHKAFNFHDRNPKEFTYSEGICPVVERMYYKEFIGHEFMRPSMTKNDLDQVIEAFYKVDENMSEIVDRQSEL